MNEPGQSPRSSHWQLRLSERRTLLLLGDFFAGLIALFISLYYWGMSERFMGFSMEFIQKRVPGWFYLLPLVWLVLMVELYDVHRAVDFWGTIRGVVAAGIMGFILYLVLYFYYYAPPTSLLPRRGIASFIIAVSILTLFWRWLYIRVFSGSQFKRRALLVGAGKGGQFLSNAFSQVKATPFALIGIIDDDSEKHGSEVDGIPVIGSSENLLDLIREQNISDVIVAISGDMRGSMFQSLLDAQELGVEIIRMPTAYEDVIGRVPIMMLESNWILKSFVDELRTNGFYILSKRLMDILGGALGTLIMLALFPLIAILTLLDDGFPIFYSQERLGKGGQAYNILKFRTMSRDAEADGLRAGREKMMNAQPGSEGCSVKRI